MSLPIGSDLYVKFKDVRRLDTNAPITSITSCTATIRDTSGNAVTSATASMSQIGSTSAYEGVIPDTGTANMTNGVHYDLEVVLIESGSSWKRTYRKRDTASYD